MCFMLGIIFLLDLLWPRFLSRYYFPGWYNSGNSLYAHRYGVSKGTESPVMDDCVMAYHFFQVSLHDLHLISLFYCLFSSVWGNL